MDHDEYDSINPVLLNASARDLQRYVDASNHSLLDEEGGDVSRPVRVLNAEVPSVRHLVIGDLNHIEYDSINPVLLNASARDLQGYVDALLSLSLLDDSIDWPW